ncbi:MAG: hypothetical protein LBQ47_08705 [Endomicrobium sp.]|jgi:hypothetical protein|nr:hypothetical protein [Endomicrobium sp.]
MKGQILVQNDKLISVAVQIYFFKRKGQSCVYAECPALGIISDGKNLETAKKMFQEAFDLWLEIVNEKGNIRAVLKELGWKLTKTSVTPKEIPYDIPIELLASKTVNLSIAGGLN